MLTRMVAQGICAMVYTVEVALVLLAAQEKYKKKYYLKAKMICSISFVIIATIFAAVSNHWKYYLLLLPAMVFCVIGDFALGLFQIKRQERQRILGIAAFLLAHIVFITAWFLLDATFNMWNIVLPPAGIVIMYILKKLPSMEFGKLWIPSCVYCFFLTMMFAKGTQYMVLQPNISSAWTGLGAILFFISDALISFLYFYDYKEPKNRRIVNIINLTTYFFALLAFDMSILYY